MKKKVDGTLTLDHLETCPSDSGHSHMIMGDAGGADIGGGDAGGSDVGGDGG
jgi:hypothetical protein